MPGSPSVTLTATTLDTEVGRLMVVAGPAGGLRTIHFMGAVAPSDGEPEFTADERARTYLSLALRAPVLPGQHPALARAVAELRGYFGRRRRHFGLALDPDGTPFDARVWGALREIPYGETTTYGELARDLGQPSATRAVARACGRNPLPIVVPCHRVVAAEGAIGGFGGGAQAKLRLLALEGARTPPLLRLLGASTPDDPAPDGLAWLEARLGGGADGHELAYGILERLDAGAWPEAVARVERAGRRDLADIAATVLESFAQTALSESLPGPALASFARTAARLAPVAWELYVRGRRAPLDREQGEALSGACESLMADEALLPGIREGAVSLWLELDPEGREAQLARLLGSLKADPG